MIQAIGFLLFGVCWALFWMIRTLIMASCYVGERTINAAAGRSAQDTNTDHQEAAAPTRPRDLKAIYKTLPDAPDRPHRPPGWIGLYDDSYRYEFQVLSVQSEIRLYILASPSYGSRRVNAHLAHRYYDRTVGLHYVCCEDPVVDFADAKEWARIWCQYTTHYIETGEDLFAA